jgi:hypothetical protein
MKPIKYRIFDTFQEFENARLNTEKRLGIPNKNAKQYCSILRVTNQDHQQYNKYIFPVHPKELFFFDEAGKLFDFDTSWIHQGVDI